MGFTDYVQIIAKHFVFNDKNISKIHKNQGKKLRNLISVVRVFEKSRGNMRGIIVSLMNVFFGAFRKF